MDNKQMCRALRERTEAFLASGGVREEGDALFRLVVQLCPGRVDFRKVCENLYDGIHITDGEGFQKWTPEQMQQPKDSLNDYLVKALYGK